MLSSEVEFDEILLWCDVCIWSTVCMCAAMICLPALVTFLGSKTRIGLKTKLVKLYIYVYKKTAAREVELLERINL